MFKLSKNMKNHALQAIKTHLNAPYGPVVSVEHVVDLLKNGKTALCNAPEAAPILLWTFAECSPLLIKKACADLGLSDDDALASYLSLVKAGGPVVSSWASK